MGRRSDSLRFQSGHGPYVAGSGLEAKRLSFGVGSLLDIGIYPLTWAFAEAGCARRRTGTPAQDRGCPDDKRRHRRSFEYALDLFLGS
jgi:hypothetical protein